MRRLCLASAAVLLAGCAGLRPGPQRGGVTVDAEGAAPELPEAIAQAERQAVSELVDLFVSSSARAASGRLIEDKFLSAPRAYLRRFKVLARGGSGPGVRVRVRCLVRADRLARDLDEAGLVRPEGISGSPKLVISIKEGGPGSWSDVGYASDMLRRRLSARGFRALDLSDGLESRRRFSGSPAEALSAAKAAGAGVIFVAEASVQPAPDARLAGYQSYRARLAGRARETGSGRPLGEIEVEATAVDISSAAAAAKALENAGALAADRLAAAMDGRFRARTELDLSVLGLGGLARVRAFVEQLRGLPGVAGAAVSAWASGGVRFRVFVEDASPDEFTALLLRLPGQALNVRAVESDYNFIELEASGSGA
ncbi:MAG: hypothetical protein PHF00_08180 [Elusimicrobia bacterium]|nr:hypothetical protein [Elusimicrobiota bacterium]